MKYAKLLAATAALTCTSVFAQDPPKTEAQAEAEAPQAPRGGRFLDRADANQDGKVTYEELKAVVPNMPEDRFKKMDRNGDGALSPEEFPARGARLAQADTNGDKKISKEEFKTAFPKVPEDRFSKVDTNGDGAIDQTEAQQLRDLMRPREGAGEGDGRQHILGKADKDGDGKVSADEFKEIAPKAPEERFKQMDRNGDGFLSKDDFAGGAGPKAKAEK